MPCPAQRAGPKGKLLSRPAATQRGEAEPQSTEQRERRGLGCRRRGSSAGGSVVPTLSTHQVEVGSADRRELALADERVVGIAKRVDPIATVGLIGEGPALWVGGAAIEREAG